MKAAATPCHVAERCEAARVTEISCGARLVKRYDQLLTLNQQRGRTTAIVQIIYISVDSGNDVVCT